MSKPNPQDVYRQLVVLIDQLAQRGSFYGEELFVVGKLRQDAIELIEKPSEQD